MNQIYLVCTRSAISASALTYIINQSPEFYNVVHKNLWLKESGPDFEDATIIEDWWNIPTSYVTTYNHSVRNNVEMTLSRLKAVCKKWKKLTKNKNLALFTHATNVKDIMKWRDEYNLPIVVITTIMGKNSYKYMDMYLKREYNTEMNRFVSLQKTWQHVYNQYLIQDTKWSEHADHTFSMDHWLESPAIVYNELHIEQNYNIDEWIDEYKILNKHEEWDTGINNVNNNMKMLCYVYSTYSHLFDTKRAKKLFALAILKAFQTPTETLKDVDYVVKSTENIIRKQLTLA